MQAKARGIAYEKKKRKRLPPGSAEGASSTGANGVNDMNMSGLSNGNVHSLPGQQ